MRRMWMLRHLGVVDAFSCPSHFMLDFYVRWGLPEEKLHHITNGQHRYGHTQPSLAGAKKRFGFFGQMVDVKGIQIILRAVQLLRSEGFTDFVVELNGENARWASAPVREEIEVFLEAEQALVPGER